MTERVLLIEGVDYKITDDEPVWMSVAALMPLPFVANSRVRQYRTI
jgi:hypothetical protein